MTENQAALLRGPSEQQNGMLPQPREV